MIRGQGARALGILGGCAVCAVVYLGIVVLVSLFWPRRVLQVGEPRCFYEWCIAVEGVHRTPGNAGVSYVVNLRLSSSARVAQRNRNVIVYLTDDRGRRYDPAPQTRQLPQCPSTSCCNQEDPLRLRASSICRQTLSESALSSHGTKAVSLSVGSSLVRKPGSASPPSSISKCPVAALTTDAAPCRVWKFKASLMSEFINAKTHAKSSRLKIKHLRSTFHGALIARPQARV